MSTAIMDRPKTDIVSDNIQTLFNRIKEVSKLRTPSIDIRELKYMVHEHFHTPGNILDALDKVDFLPHERCIRTDSSGIPSTGKTLQEKIAWSDLRKEINSLSSISTSFRGQRVPKIYYMALKSWVGINDENFNSHLEGLEPKEYEKLKENIQIRSVKALCKRLAKYM